MKQILEKLPELSPKRIVLRDRKDVLEMAKTSGLLPEEVVFMEHDFRTEQPVKGWSLKSSIFVQAGDAII